MRPALEASSIVRRFGRFLALNGLDLAVGEGEKCALAGPNGVGKTTFLRICVGVLVPTSGSLRLFGQDPRKSIVRRVVGYIPEEPVLLNERLSVGAFLGYFANLYGLRKRSRIGEALDQVGLAGKVSSRVGTLSRGLKQRLSIARALLHQPKLLLLDEPFLGLDPRTVVDIRRLLLDMRDTSVLLCSHNLHEIGLLCDRVCVLDSGRVVKEARISSTTDVESLYLSVRGDTCNE
jgi:ABC-2 type transport system ATP-binding protein